MRPVIFAAKQLIAGPLNWSLGSETIQDNAQIAHGLSGNLELPDWPPLELHEVNALLRNYPEAGGAMRILSHSPRPFSSASLVATPHGTVFVKRHHRSVRSRNDLMEEHRLIEYLAEAFDKQKESVGVTSTPMLVQPPLRNFTGETVVCLGDWTYEVHPQAPGLDVYEQLISWQPFRSSWHAHAAGEALANLHRAVRGYSAPARRTQQLVSSFTIFSDSYEGRAGTSGSIDLHESEDLICGRMCDYLSSRPRLSQYAEDRKWRASMRELFLPFYSELAPWLAYLESLWTHNDFHSSNLMWSSKEETANVTSIVDFGLADRTNAVHELATAIERNIVEWLRMEVASADLVHFDHLKSLLDGYESLSPLSYEHARALAAMLPLVHCEFALSETNYFLSILDSEEKACLAYEGYFLGHSEWFLSDQGKGLLSWLREWAEKHPRNFGGAR